MKRLTSTLLFMACCSGLYNTAQAQQCKYLKNEMDKFTQQKSILTEPVSVVSEHVKMKKVYNIEKINLQARLEDGKRALIITYNFALGTSVANTTNKVMLILSNGDLLELPCLQNIPNQIKKFSGVAVLSYAFGIDDAAYEKLRMSNITDVRMTAVINPVDFKIMDGVNTIYMFRCIQ